jgi:hypothetical protein
MLDEFIHEPPVAYFSMEIALRNEIPTYAGGLGVLTGDTMSSATDLDLSLMAVLIDLDRFHLVMDVADGVPELSDQATYLKQHMRDKLTECRQYITRYGQDMPEILEWKWHYAAGKPA